MRNPAAAQQSVAAEADTYQVAGAERRSLDRVIASLSVRFPRAPRSVIEGAVDRRYMQFSGAPIREYIPVMVERDATADLRAQLGTLPLHKTVVTS